MRRIEMNHILSIISLQVENFKNITNGKIEFPNVSNFERNNVLGIYGQNASGKTAIIKAMSILKDIISLSDLPKRNNDIIKIGTDTANLVLTYQINDMELKRVYEGSYEVTIKRSVEGPVIIREKVTVTRDLAVENQIDYNLENLKATRTLEITCDLEIEGNLFNYTNSKARLSNLDFSDLKPEEQIRLQVRSEDSREKRRSLIFHKDMKSIVPEEIGKTIYKLQSKFINHTFIIEPLQMAMLYDNVFLPINFYMSEENLRSGGTIGFSTGNVGLNHSEDFMLLDNKSYEIADKLFAQINKILPNLIPSLKVKLEKQGEKMMENGEKRIRTGLISIREGEELPFSYESEGVKKLVSLISLFSAMYNERNMLVIIDELDAGVHEYLLGQIMRVLSDDGKGQLLFTSHNIHLLEVLNKDNFVFSTVDDTNRFIKFKNVKKSNNLREMYLRNIILQNGDTKIYEETDAFDIRKSFER